MQEWTGAIWVLVPVVAIIGGIASAMVATVARARVRELEIRERIALIEKGIVPPPEVDPRGFDAAMGYMDRVQDGRRYPNVAAGRHRRAGITLLGVGLGLMVLIGFSGAPEIGMGVGGFICILGLAFLINSFFDARALPPQPFSAPPPSSTQRTAASFTPPPAPPSQP